MKTSDSKEQFICLAKKIKNGELESLTGSMSKKLIHEKIERIETLLDGIIKRGEMLLRKAEKLGESHSSHISLHMDVMNSKLTLLGAVLGPTIAMATLTEITPTIIENPALIGFLIGGAISSVTLLMIAKLRRLF